MDTLKESGRKQDECIRKNNLWKFFKALRAQANQIYCLLVASPIHYAWITIFDKNDHTLRKHVSISQFVNSLDKMPSEGKYYGISVNTYDVEACCRQEFIVQCRRELSVGAFAERLSGIVAYHCAEAAGRGEPFEITSQTVRHYKFKSRYIAELKGIVAQCNSLLIKHEISSNL